MPLLRQREAQGGTTGGLELETEGLTALHLQVLGADIGARLQRGVVGVEVERVALALGEERGGVDDHLTRLKTVHHTHIPVGRRPARLHDELTRLTVEAAAVVLKQIAEKNGAPAEEAAPAEESAPAAE